MGNYFFDTEFWERPGEAGHVIELISIGIVTPSGRELYAEVERVLNGVGGGIEGEYEGIDGRHANCAVLWHGKHLRFYPAQRQFPFSRTFRYPDLLLAQPLHERES